MLVRLLIILFIITNLSGAFGQSVGLVLSGGGARAYSHIGVLKALEENNIPVHYITGTSMGALVGSMYAIGLSPKQIEDLVTSKEVIDRSNGKKNINQLYFFNDKDPDASWVTIKFSYDSILRMRLPESVIKSSAIDYALMESYAPAVAKAKGNFDSLFVPFRCVASDIKNREPVIFSHGDLARAVRASMAFPFYLSPVAVDGRVMFDGGLYDNFPCDLMLNTYNPDIIIGSSVGNDEAVVVEDNLLSQVRTMIVQRPTNYNVPRPTDILIVPESSVGIFDFEDAKAAIEAGYEATKKQLPLILQSIKTRIYSDTLQLKRAAFFTGQQAIEVGKIEVSGVNKGQQEYIEKTLRQQNKKLISYYLSRNFSRLVANDNIRQIFPILTYNDSTNLYDLRADVKRNKDLQVDFGGNFSSRPINTGFIGVQYQWLNRFSYRAYGNIYFGKLYNSGHASLRIDIPGKHPYFIQPEITFNSFNYYRSSSLLLEDIKPAYLIQDDWKTGIRLGVPSRQIGKIYGDASYFNIRESYYQTRSFSQADTADITKFYGFTVALNYERNTLNKKMYANQGSYISFGLRFVSGDERTMPGTNSINQDTIRASHQWLQFKFSYENYFAKAGPVRFAFLTELVASTQGFFANYTASILAAPVFQPIAETKTIFLPQYHSHNYGGLGLKTVYTPFRNFDLRLEGYAFQPYQEILPGINNDKPNYGDAWAKRYFIGSFDAIYHTPVGPASLGINYYQDFDDPIGIMFHFGYILFNKRALD
ncbi:MAG: patatin-like phospholipase family protein [Bacteroidia bacterium]|nr:patatin-like phospholipase family protein [Bacteroidia bacterium]